MERRKLGGAAQASGPSANRLAPECPAKARGLPEAEAYGDMDFGHPPQSWGPLAAQDGLGLGQWLATPELQLLAAK
eukprot:9505813-Lingulodinium_polyedra.AAC.1